MSIERHKGFVEVLHFALELHGVDHGALPERHAAAAGGESEAQGGALRAAREPGGASDRRGFRGVSKDFKGF